MPKQKNGAEGGLVNSLRDTLQQADVLELHVVAALVDQALQLMLKEPVD